jgi:hypothetical protein
MTIAKLYLSNRVAAASDLLENYRRYARGASRWLSTAGVAA